MLAVGAVLADHPGGGGVPLTATLTGAAEVPGPGDPDGSGFATLRLNPGQEEICYELTVEGIAPASMAHIHSGQVTEAGGIEVHLAAPTSGTSSACVTVARELILAIIRNPEKYYVNVHNATYPRGAVRGQRSIGQ